MSMDWIRSELEALPELTAWPEIAKVFDQAGSVPRPDWELPALVAEAVGGRREDAQFGSTAVACMQISIMLVDDMLDNDPRGVYRERGVGPTANMALAFQAAAFRVIAGAELDAKRLNAATYSLARMALATAVGQHLDVQNLTGEESYWRVVEAKSTPFYGSAYEVGALLGGADIELAQQAYQFGTIIGEIIQIEDDINDALAVPANADWAEGRNNLLILFASTAPHPQRSRFNELRGGFSDADALREAQAILVKSGALSFAVHHLVRRYKQAVQQLNAMKIAEPELLQEKLDAYGDTLAGFLRRSGMEVDRSTLLDSS